MVETPTPTGCPELEKLLQTIANETAAGELLAVEIVELSVTVESAKKAPKTPFGLSKILVLVCPTVAPAVFTTSQAQACTIAFPAVFMFVPTFGTAVGAPGVCVTVMVIVT